MGQHHHFHFAAGAGWVAQGSARQALAAVDSDAAFPVPEVTSQSKLSRKECGVASASPVHSPALYCQATSISSFSQDVRLCTEHVCITRAGIFLPLNHHSHICQDISVGDECQEYSANQTWLFIKHMKGRFLNPCLLINTCSQAGPRSTPKLPTGQD